MAEQWLSIVEYARTFGISDMTIRRRIRTGRIQAVLRDGKYYIPTDSDPNTGEPLKQTNKSQVRATQTHHHVQAHVVKSHPNADRTLPGVRANSSFAGSHHVGSRPAAPVASVARPQIPASVLSQISTDAEISVEASALLEYCNATLENVRDKEKLVEARFQAKIETLSEQLRNRDMEIRHLQQQVEDLQLLVQILEKKKL